MLVGLVLVLRRAELKSWRRKEILAIGGGVGTVGLEGGFGWSSLGQGKGLYRRV